MAPIWRSMSVATSSETPVTTPRANGLASGGRGYHLTMKRHPADLSLDEVLAELRSLNAHATERPGERLRVVCRVTLDRVLGPGGEP